MEIFSLPTAKHVNMLPRVLENLEADCLRIDAKVQGALEVTTTEKVAVLAKATLLTILAATYDVAVNSLLVAAKVVPIALNETIGRALGLSQYVTSPALKRSELLAHANNVANALVVCVNALLVLSTLESPRMAAVIGREIGVFPVTPDLVQDKGGTANSNTAGTAATEAVK